MKTKKMHKKLLQLQIILLNSIGKKKKKKFGKINSEEDKLLPS